MLKKLTVTVFACMIVSLAFAQDGERGRGEGRRIRTDRSPRPNLNQIAERLKADLKLDEQQVQQVDEIVARHQASMDETRGLWREMRQAMQDGDEQRAAEIREQLRGQGGGGPGFPGERGSGIEAVLDEIQPILHDDQLEAFQAFRERVAQERGPRGRMDLRRVMRELPDVVGMNDEQRQSYEELLDQRREEMRQRFMERRQRGDDQGQDGQEGRDGPGRGMPFDPEQMMAEFFDQVAKLLDAQQQQKLNDYRAQLEQDQQAQQETPETEGLRNILSAAKRVRDLDDAQKEELRALEQETLRQSRRLRRSDTEGHALLAADAKERIVKLLSAEQKEEFQKNLERLGARGNRRPAEGRDRPARERNRP